MAIAQIRQLQDPRIVIENVPKAPLSGGDSLFGYTPEMIQSLIDCTESKFCLDFVHAAKAALSQQEIFSDSLLQWIALKPSVFHLADTMLHNEFDEHLDLGAGEMNLPLCVDKILDSANPKIVLETPKRDCLSNDNLNLAVMRDLLHKAGYVFDR